MNDSASFSRPCTYVWSYCIIGFIVVQTLTKFHTAMFSEVSTNRFDSCHGHVNRPHVPWSRIRLNQRPLNLSVSQFSVWGIIAHNKLPSHSFFASPSPSFLKISSLYDPCILLVWWFLKKNRIFLSMIRKKLKIVKRKSEC